MLVRSGKTTWITAAGFLWQLRGDGTPGVPISGGVPATDMDAGIDTPLLVSGRRLPADYTCGSAPGCQYSAGGPFNPIVCDPSCRIYDYKYALQFLALYSTSTSEVFSFDSDAAPAVHNDGREILIAWFRGTQSQGGQVVLSRLHSTAPADFGSAVHAPVVLGAFGPDAGPTRPDVATDGQRSVVVWRTRTPAGDHDIAGAVIDADGKVTPLIVASSPADERDPSVVAAGPGRFLVAYQRIQGDEHRIAGRTLTFASRRRAM